MRFTITLLALVFDQHTPTIVAAFNDEQGRSVRVTAYTRSQIEYLQDTLPYPVFLEGVIAIARDLFDKHGILEPTPHGAAQAHYSPPVSYEADLPGSTVLEYYSRFGGNITPALMHELQAAT
jgi:hypothetical protein